MSTRLSHVSQRRDAEPRANLSRSLALAALAIVTSLAVGRAFSWWLVPGYLALMVWLVAPSARRDTRTPAPATTDTEPDSSAAEDSPEPSPAPAAEPLSAEAPPRTRKRTRKAKPKLAVEPPEPAVWVRVGPGQFVRAEGLVEPAPEASATDPVPPPDPPPEASPEPPATDPAPRRRRAVRFEPPRGFHLRPTRYRRSTESRSSRWKATPLLID